MSTSFEGSSSRKQQKIDKIMRDTLWDIVRTPGAQRWLVRLVLIAPAMLAIGYLTYFGGTFFLPLGLAVTAVMTVSGLLLQKSVRKITILPDEYLDERQISLRNHAYRIAYRRLSQVGFGLWIAAFVVGVCIRLGAIRALQHWAIANSGTLHSDGHLTQNFGQWVTNWAWFQLERSISSPWGIYLLVSLVVWLVSVAPLAVIAWNEAKRGGGVKGD